MVINPEERLEILNRAGWQVWDYNGKIDQAPRQIRHLVRELPKGLYPVNFKINRIAGAALPKDKEPQAVMAYVQAFKDTFNKAGWVFFLKFTHDGGIPTYVHYDALPHDAVSKNVERLTIDRGVGYYAARGNTIIGPFKYPVDLTDALIESEMSALMEGISVDNTGAGQWIFTEFGNQRGGIVTDGPIDQGLVVAYIPQFAGAVAFGRLATIAPDMFQLLYEINSTARPTEEHIEDWQNRSRLIVGHINS